MRLMTLAAMFAACHEFTEADKRTMDEAVEALDSDPMPEDTGDLMPPLCMRWGVAMSTSRSDALEVALFVGLDPMSGRYRYLGSPLTGVLDGWRSVARDGWYQWSINDPGGATATQWVFYYAAMRTVEDPTDPAYMHDLAPLFRAGDIGILDPMDAAFLPYMANILLFTETPIVAVARPVCLDNGPFVYIRDVQLASP